MSNADKLDNVRRLITDYNGPEDPPEPPMPPTNYVTHAEFQSAMNRIDLRFEQSATKSDIAEVKSEIHKWLLGTVLAIIGTMLAALFGIAQIWKNSAPTTTAQPPAIIINVPSQPPVALPSPK